MLLGILCIASLLFTQQNTGALKGTVTDQLGSLVVGAKVTVRNARGVANTATKNSSGVYEFRRLEPGIYELKIVSPGFSVYEEKEIEIQARELKTVNAQLEVGLEAAAPHSTGTRCDHGCSDDTLLHTASQSPASPDARVGPSGSTHTGLSC